MEVAEPAQEPIPRAPLPHAFTRENAAENARKATIARQERIAREQAERENDSLTREQERAEMVSEQITRTRKELNGTLEPRERAQLLVAMDKLLDRERILRGKPLPAS